MPYTTIRGMRPGQIHGPITTAPPFDRPPVTARVDVDRDAGGTTEQELPGTALGWTRDAVLVEISHEGMRYEVWVQADRVTRRT